MTPSRRRLVLRWTLLGGGLLTLLIVHYIGKWSPGDDEVRYKGELTTYLYGASRMIDGREIYRPDEYAPFSYPPAAAIPFMPLLGLGRVAKVVAWFLISVSLVAGSIFVLGRTVARWIPERGSRPRPVWFLWVAVALLAGRHIAAALENKSHDVYMLMFIVVLARFAAAGRELGAAAMAAVGAAFKATPLLFLPTFVWQRRFKAAAAMVAVTAVLCLLPDVFWPRDDGGSWAKAWVTTFVMKVSPGAVADHAHTWSPWNPLNQSLAGTINRLATQPGPTSRDVWPITPLTLSGTPLKLITLAAQGAVFVLLLWATRRRRAGDASESDAAFRRFGEVGAVACAMVLLSPMSSKSNFCVLLVPLTFCAIAYFYRGGGRALGIQLLMIALIGNLTVKGVLGIKAGTVALSCGSVTLCTLLTLTATCQILLRPPAPASVSGGA
ncbi:MAG: glycosyltransferase family 87 protein [Planctomycetota bacterium]